MEPNQPPLVLIIDDDPLVVELLEDVLKAEGNATYVAHDGEGGLRHFYRYSPDLVILDLAMPEMDGFTTLGAPHQVSSCPVMIVTAYGATEDIRKAIELGADGYLVKPFQLGDFIEEVNMLLSRAWVVEDVEGNTSSGPVLQVECCNRPWVEEP